MWQVIATGEYQRWLMRQDAAVQAELDALIHLLEEMGPRLSRPYADTLKGSRYANMKELRVNAKRRFGSRLRLIRIAERSCWLQAISEE